MPTNVRGRSKTVVSTLLGATLLLGACGPSTYVRPTRVDDGRDDDRWLDGPGCAKGAPDDPALRVEVVEPGDGEVVERGMTVRVHFLATTSSGEVLHDTHVEGPPDDIIVGSTPVICGFERGLLGMRAGERRRIHVPWTLAFGESGRPPAVGPRTDVVFLVDLYLPADYEPPAMKDPNPAPGKPSIPRLRRPKSPWGPPPP